MARNPCYVLQGFREDCSRLIARFEKLNTVRYEAFCGIWQDMQFSLVFVGRKSFIELLEFCENSLTIAKEFFLPPLSFRERIGGLYLLYGLYFRMPVEGPKIRVKVTELQDILKFKDEISQAEHHDASFILFQLMNDNAFMYSFLNQEMGLENNYRSKTDHAVNRYSLLPKIRELAAPDDLFDRINVMSKHYESLKCLETSRPSTSSATNDSHRELQLYDSNFGEKLLDSVKQLENARKVSVNAALNNPIRNKIARKPSCTKKKNDDTRKGKRAKNRIRSIAGHGFDTDSSTSEDDKIPAETSENTEALPDPINDLSSSE